MNLLVFAFADTVATTVMEGLTSPYVIQKTSLCSAQDTVDVFINNTDFTPFSHIIGMGMYNGCDQDKIRIESICTSKFRNQGDSNQRSTIPYFLSMTENFKVTQAIGNSWCNLVSYTLVTLLPDMPYTFLHIPRRCNTRQASTIIDAAIARAVIRYT